jgi:hypothetical protein
MSLDKDHKVSASEASVDSRKALEISLLKGLNRFSEMHLVKSSEALEAIRSKKTRFL